VERSDDEHGRYMRLALREARKGLGRTSPNPCVGAVVVKDGKIIATGYHRQAGTPHAEIHALQAAGTGARGATLYVTLEPCNHFGRTPPCSHAIAAAGIATVVIGMLDPNPLVDGSGADYLRSRGINVLSGILDERCRELNRGFIKHITTSVPWVVMKAGMSLDGRIGFCRGQRAAITGPESHRQVHRLRDRFDAILVGSGTVQVDDPSLTTRLPSGKGHDPVRVVLDSRLSIDPRATVLSQASTAPTLIFCTPQAPEPKRETLAGMARVEVVEAASDGSGRLSLPAVLQELGRRGIVSVMVEGGAAVHGAFLAEELVDHAVLFMAPIFTGGEVPVLAGPPLALGREGAPYLRSVSLRRCGADIMLSGDVVYPD
jgi:diaminohydroxyphosphoribosylaminopyrimidine deaminase/5-amino-6-(5-phosphoribosylamino)uracil reductase